MNFHYFSEKLLVAVVDVIIEIEDAVCGTVCYQHVSVGGDSGDVPLLAVGDAVVHEHRDSVEFNPSYFDTRIAEVVHV